MPVEMTTIQLPGGASCMRAVTSGLLSREDAEIIAQAIRPGGPYHRMPRMYLAQKQVSVSSEARSVLSPYTKGESWVAVVTDSTLIRVAANLVMRLSSSRRMRMFSTEAEAIRWLDERAREAPHAL